MGGQRAGDQSGCYAFDPRQRIHVSARLARCRAPDQHENRCGKRRLEQGEIIGLDKGQIEAAGHESRRGEASAWPLRYPLFFGKACVGDESWTCAFIILAMTGRLTLSR